MLNIYLHVFVNKYNCVHFDNLFKILLGCGHCKKMKPEYEAAAAKMKEQDVRLNLFII